MNKAIASVGCAVLSAVSLQAQYDSTSVSGPLTPLESSKPWSVSAAVRGFYDDNYLTLPKSYPSTGGGYGHPLASWGTEVSPSAALNSAWQDGYSSETYVYDMQWYENKSTVDQTHEFNWNAQQEFSERYKLSLGDSFVVAQEPSIIDPSVISTPLRVEGNNIRNTAHADFTASLTKLFDVHVGYQNSVYAYQQIDRSVVGYPFFGPPTYGSTPAVPSYSDLLDRMEQLATLDLRWKATPETTGILGYQYGHTDFTSPGYIIYPYPGPGYYTPPAAPGVPATSAGFHSNVRNSDSHFGFVGADETFSPELSGSLRLGAEYLDYYNYGTSRVSPYVDGSLTYQYLPGDSAQLGVKHVHNATDVVGFVGGQPVLDEESTAIYISDTHRFSDKFTVTAMGQAQISTFDGGGAGYNGKEEDFFIAQINFAYHFNPWLSAEAGYNYSKLNSDLLYRSYTRDVMYLGFRATY